MSARDTLFRIVPAADWEQATRSGAIPRCPADQRENRVHLNERGTVEHAADLWFSPEERPLALEVDVSALQSNLRWELRASAPLEVWPNLYVPHLTPGHVVAVHRLARDHTGHFRFSGIIDVPADTRDLI